jgi:UDP-N-acetylmuramate: L-alanyl-gamma-D-glutamyl-meso-diaminopimelate ligase
MSDFLKSLNISILDGYGPKHLSPTPDLVIVGNVVTRANPEAVECARLNIPYVSLPEALRYFAMEGKKSIVVSGTHGKTTTTSLVAWILERAGLDPSFMIGGIPSNFHRNFKTGRGPYFVIEGDEYDTAFFDKVPKFLHYNPYFVILTSIEFDHADIYKDINHVIDSFKQLISLVPKEGLLIANGDDPIVLEESKRAKCPVITYGLDSDTDWTAENIFVQESGTQVSVRRNGETYMTLETPLYGRHNLGNLLSALILSDYLGINRKGLAAGVRSFKGVKRRQEIKGEREGILIIDDFAHHPTAVAETVHAVKEKYVGRRLIAVFEPRSNTSRRNVFQEQYLSSFEHADLILIPEPSMLDKIAPSERFSSSTLVAGLKARGSEAIYLPDTDQLLEEIIRQAKRGDVVLIMSNGSFDNLVERVLKRLDNL